jgi:anaerobic magnesium-protoporphyrin IX monomethyl ester cyclase
MKVLLVNPPFQRLKGVSFNFFSLGLGYVAAGAADAHHVRIYDGELPAQGESMKALHNVAWLQAHQNLLHALETPSHPVWRQVAEIVADFRPEVVGLSVSTPAYRSARNVSRIVKEWNNRCIVVWGGAHPTLAGRDVLEREQDVDFVVRGEGEITFKELLDQLERGGGADLGGVEGLSFRRGGGVVDNPSRDFIADLDSIAFPRRDLLLNAIDPPRAFRNLMGSRGCPYGCAYCASKELWKRQVRFRSAESIVQEIRLLKSTYGVEEFEFWDDSFTLRRSWVAELCQRMIADKMGLFWWCNTRADLLDEDMLRLMKHAGCSAIHIGVETGSERTLASLDRKVTPEVVLKASALLDKVGMSWYAYFMYGFPQETLEDIELTRALMRKLSAAYVTYSIFNPYPGTQLFEECKKLGLVDADTDWSRFSHQSPDNCFNNQIDRTRFNQLIMEIALECDRINSSIRKRIERIMGKRKYYLRNPAAFVRLIGDWIDRRRLEGHSTAPPEPEFSAMGSPVAKTAATAARALKEQ